MVITVHNQDSGIKLISPVYFCNCGAHYEYPVERTDDGAMMKINFRFDPNQNESRGILMYEIKREENAISDHQFNLDTKEVIKDAPKMTQLLVTWKIEHLKEPKLVEMFVEHSKELVLNEGKLAQLYDKINNIPPGYHTSTWLIYDDIIFQVTREVVHKEGLELKITIHKEFRCLGHIVRPIWIESER
jgi:hypothetical protein